MTNQQLLLSLCHMAILVSLMMLGTRAQTCPTTRQNSGFCANYRSYFASYNRDTCQGFKLLDGIDALHDEVRLGVSYSCPKVQ